MPLPNFPHLSFSYLALGYKWDPTQNLFAHKEELLTYFKPDPQITKENLRDALSEALGLPDRFFRSSSDHKAAVLLNNHMQETFANLIASRAYTLNKYSSDPANADAFTALGRGTAFLHNEDENAPDAFNAQLLQAAAQFKDNPAPLRDLMFGELTRLREKLGLNNQQDIDRLFNIPDVELVNKFEDISHYTRLLTEIKNGGLTHFFTQEQLNQLQDQSALIDTMAILEERANLIANPLYTEIDPRLLFDQKQTAQKYHQTLAGNVPGVSDDNVGYHYTGDFFNSVTSVFNLSANAVPDRLPILNPALAGAFNTAEEKDAVSSTLMNGGQVVVFGSDRQQYVVSGKAALTNLPTTSEYTKELLDRVAKADKFLLTGSKQFDTMWKELQKLHEAQDLGWTNAEQKKRAEELVKAATTYLGYKNGSYPDSYAGYASVRGKNQREQTRLEVAGDILTYARAQVSALEKEIERRANVAKEAENLKRTIQKKVEPFKNVKFDLSSASMKEKFLTATLPESFNAVFSRTMPMTATVKDGKPVEVRLMEQEQFGQLCALVAGSPHAFYKLATRARDNQGKPIYERNEKTGKLDQPVYNTKIYKNENPEQTYSDMMKAVFNKRSITDLAPELEKMLTGATTLIFYAVKEGNFDTVGQMLADGLKLNAKLMQAQPRFTPEFYTQAKLAANALDLMEKIPALKSAIEEHMSPEELQTVRACKAVHDVITDGLEAHKALINRFGRPNKAEAFSRGDGKDDLGILGDMAKLYHMNMLEKKLIGGFLDLSTAEYGKDPAHAQNVNKILAGDKDLRAFVDQLEGMEQIDRNNAISNTKAMMQRCDQSMQNIERAVLQQQQQSQIQQNQIQQNQPNLNVAQPMQPKHIS